jgi:Cu/Ag efflux protein CusF
MPRGMPAVAPSTLKGNIMNNQFIHALLLSAAFGGTVWAQNPADATLPSVKAVSPITHLAVGTVRSVDAAARSATIDHQAIPSLNMPAMTMQFRLPASLTQPLRPGQSIAFTFTASSDGLTLGSAQVVGAAAEAGRDGSAMGDSMPGMDHDGMHGKVEMKGMMDSCHAMMGRR